MRSEELRVELLVELGVLVLVSQLPPPRLPQQPQLLVVVVPRLRCYGHRMTRERGDVRLRCVFQVRCVCVKRFSLCHQPRLQIFVICLKMQETWRLTEQQRRVELEAREQRLAVTLRLARGARRDGVATQQPLDALVQLAPLPLALRLHLQHAPITLPPALTHSTGAFRTSSSGWFTKFSKRL